MVLHFGSETIILVFTNGIFALILSVAYDFRRKRASKIWSLYHVSVIYVYVYIHERIKYDQREHYLHPYSYDTVRT